MIEAIFRYNSHGMCSFEISGHAGLAEYGQDVLCAAVTSAVQLTANGVTEILHLPASLNVEENRLSLSLSPQLLDAQKAVFFLEALYLHLKLLMEDYPEYLQVSIQDV